MKTRQKCVLFVYFIVAMLFILAYFLLWFSLVSKKTSFTVCSKRIFHIFLLFPIVIQS